MKKQPLLYVLLGMLIAMFCVGFVLILQSSNEAASGVFLDLQQAASNAQAQQNQPVVQQTQPTQTYYEQPTYSQNPQTAPSVQQPTQVYSNPAVILDVTASKEQILNAMCTAVNSVKTAQNFGAVKYQNIDMKLIECSMPFAVGIANPIIEKFTGEETLNYQFVNGSCIGPKSGEPVTPNLVIPPSDRLFSLDGNGITSAVVTQDGYDTTYSISLVPETATLEAPVPYYHALCMDYLDMNALDLGIAKINKGNYTYPGATVNVTVNQLGQIIRYEEYMPLSAFGEGSLGITASGTISGSLHEVWTFTW
ncbi:MAG: hypothetical protein IJA31_10645 [Clostridia bacterium]|nr:hypothetical protein [Clostridia bacterium]